MAPNDANAPEVVPQPPEAGPQHPEAAPPPQPYQALPPKPEYPPMISSPPPTTIYTSYTAGSSSNLAEKGNVEQQRRGLDRTVCGCTPIVFVLSAIIAVLAACVIGLAAGTGVEASRAIGADHEIYRLKSILDNLRPTVIPPPAPSSCSAPPLPVIDNGCGQNPQNVSGRSYTSFPLFPVVTYTMQCNKDVDAPNLYSLFAADFNTCMDSCSGYSKYAPNSLGVTNINATCAGVSFIPLWTNKTTALAGGAPGNCYLKRGPLERRNFITNDIGTPVHGAIVTG